MQSEDEDEDVGMEDRKAEREDGGVVVDVADMHVDAGEDSAWASVEGMQCIAMAVASALERAEVTELVEANCRSLIEGMAAEAVAVEVHRLESPRSLMSKSAVCAWE